MKKKTSLLAVFITVFSLCSHAQLKVTNNGLVAIACNNSSNSFSSYLSVGNSTSDYAASVKGSQLYSSGIYADAGMSTGNSWMIGIKGRSDRADVGLYKVGVWGDAVQGYINTIGRSYGVYGIAGNATSGWNFGVCGILDGGNYGTGIYGSASSYNIYAVDGIYAGYFNGPTKVAGNLKVTGSINGILLGASVNSSNGESIENGSFTNRLQSLRALSYTNEMDDEETVISGDTIIPAPELSSIEKQIKEHKHYGLDIEQLKDAFPELVYEEEDGKLSVNYIEMIPVLIQVINDLSSEVKSLKSNKSYSSSEQPNTYSTSVKLSTDGRLIGTKRKTK